ncbi:hypothetical protein NWP22_13620 [Anabaenopsis tanganyikae CS-531]|uniref:Uncharacterized protein n=1 Tax=Anabaenopsis tanganyikae CS-531 TaxID=2785304 RepID=A0ABT6KGJ7_9CYAN|nr:hypothetical protein [Anabaenopsis tanganyikae]MDH6106891.1 hypothetical protein [Anabaenopsis tanganyikae CS-531]
MLKLLGNLIIAVIAIPLVIIAILVVLCIAIIIAGIAISLVIIAIPVVLCISIVMSFFKESDSSSYKTEIKNRSEKSDKLFESPKPEIENNFEKAVDEL